jgi:hypothetical protein
MRFRVAGYPPIRLSKSPPCAETAILSEGVERWTARS